MLLLVAVSAKAALFSRPGELLFPLCVGSAGSRFAPSRESYMRTWHADSCSDTPHGIECCCIRSQSRADGTHGGWELHAAQRLLILGVLVELPRFAAMPLQLRYPLRRFVRACSAQTQTCSLSRSSSCRALAVLAMTAQEAEGFATRGHHAEAFDAVAAYAPRCMLRTELWSTMPNVLCRPRLMPSSATTKPCGAEQIRLPTTTSSLEKTLPGVSDAAGPILCW